MGSEWISVEERLPHDGYGALVFAKGFPPIVAWFHPLGDGSRKWFARGYPDAIPVTHWMPLPEPPEVSDD